MGGDNKNNIVKLPVIIMCLDQVEILPVSTINNNQFWFCDCAYDINRVRQGNKL